jgi:hypothetical protein
LSASTPVLALVKECRQVEIDLAGVYLRGGKKVRLVVFVFFVCFAFVVSFASSVHQSVLLPRSIKVHGG